MNRKLTIEEKGKQICFDSAHAPRTARVKARLPEDPELLTKHSLTLIGRITNPSTQRVWPLIAFFTELWKSDTRPQGADLGNGLFQFKFEREADLLQVLEKRPYHYNHWMVIVQRWEPTISPSFPCLIPFWIKVQGIPIHLWEEGTIENIGRDIGVFEKAEITPLSVRMRVQVNGLLPLITSSVVEYPNGEEVAVKLVYERIERHCSKCFRLDHELKDCLEAKAQNKALKRTQEASATAQQSDASVNEAKQNMANLVTHPPAFQFSASTKSELRERREPRESRETDGRRAHKTQPREWQERGNSRRTSQAREQSRIAKERSYREIRDSSRHRYADISQGRAYYREVRRIENPRQPALSPPITREGTSGRGVPLPSPPSPLPLEAFNEALGEVRDTMLQYTKCVDPIESEVRLERVRQAEEQGVLEKSAARMVRNRELQEGIVDDAIPERTPVELRLGPCFPLEEEPMSIDQNHLLENSQERLPATLRLGPVNDQVSPLLNSAERICATSERIPATLRLGPILDSPRAADQCPAPTTKRKPGRPPGSKSVRKDPKTTADARTKIRRVPKAKPSPRRKVPSETRKETRPRTGVGASRGTLRGSLQGATQSTHSNTSSENRPLARMIPASSRKRMDFRTPSVPGP